MHKSTNRPQHDWKPVVYRWVIVCACIFWSLPLLVYAFNGAQMRLTGDDYCYSGVLSRYGFWQGQVESYTRLNLFNGNRYALTFFSLLAALFGPQANAWLPGLALLIWVVSLSSAIYLGARALRLQRVRLGALFLALSAIGLSLSQTPGLEQSLYWRSAMLAYLAPLVALSLLAGLIAWYIQQKKSNAPILAAIFLLSVLAGGFSEIGTVFQILVFGLALVLSGWAAYQERAETQDRRTSRAVLAAFTGLSGTLIAVFLLTLSPHIQLANQTLPERAGLLTLVKMGLYNGAVFLYISLKGHWLAWSCSLLLTTSLVYLWSRKTPGAHLTSSKLLQLTTAIPVIGIGLILACMLPNAYVNQSAPELRALVIPQFAWVLTLMGLGAVCGLWLDKAARALQITGPRLVWVMLLLLSLTGAYALLPARKELDQSARYQRWAVFWDQRDTQIRLAKAGGSSELEVIQLDHIIPGVSELSPDPDFWYNNCAEMYYEVGSIAANQPGWDEGNP